MPKRTKDELFQEICDRLVILYGQTNGTFDPPALQEIYEIAKEGRKAPMKHKSGKSANTPPQEGKLGGWDWETLVASWRYFEYRSTIASSMFPCEIVRRFWGKGNSYSADIRYQIARQFADVDHGTRGEEDWTRWLDGKHLAFSCDIRSWTKFLRFCQGVVHGFTKVTASDGKTTITSDAFHVDYEDMWIPVVPYIENPDVHCFIPNEHIKKAEFGVWHGLLPAKKAKKVKKEQGNA